MNGAIKNFFISIYIHLLKLSLVLLSPFTSAKKNKLLIQNGVPIGHQLVELNRKATIEFLENNDITILKDFVQPNPAIIVDKKGILKIIFTYNKSRDLNLGVKVKIGNHQFQLIIKNFLQTQILRFSLHLKLKVIQITVYKYYSAGGKSKVYGLEFGQVIQIGKMTKDRFLLNDSSEKVFSPFDMDGVQKYDSLFPVDKVSFPIDVVYTWVDGNDPEWIERKNQKLASLGYKLPDNSTDRSKWENRDELRFSLRSLNMFAPWIRNVYIVTDNQRPTWLRMDHQQHNLFIIDHTDIFPDISQLPVFNSHAIESVLHRIKGLSEYFIYMNDDFFLGKRTFPKTFFTSGGLTKVFFSSKPMPLQDPEHCQKASEWGGLNSSSLLIEDYTRYITHKVKHSPIALKRDTLFELEERYKEQFKLTRNAPFRRYTDISTLTALYLNYGIITGKAFSSDIEDIYFNISRKSFLKKANTCIRINELPQTFCLNDTAEVEDRLSWEEQSRITSKFLNHFFPWKSIWEE